MDAPSWPRFHKPVREADGSPQQAAWAALNHFHQRANGLLAEPPGREQLERFAAAMADGLEIGVVVLWELEDRRIQRHGAVGLDLTDQRAAELATGLLQHLETSGGPSITLWPERLPALQEQAALAWRASLCQAADGTAIGLLLIEDNVDPMLLGPVMERLCAHLQLRRSQIMLLQNLQQLQDSEERLQRVLMGTNDGWWDWDLRSDQCLLSRRWIEMLGGAGGPQLQKGFWLDRLHPRWHDTFQFSLRRTLEKRGASTLEEEVELLRDDGSVLPVLVRGTTSRDPHGDAVRFSGTILDLSERKRHEAHVHRLAYYDALTELPNRRGLMEELPRAVRNCQTIDQRLAVLMIDLDGFKKLNDTHGHGAGDQMLYVVGQRLRQGVRSQDLVARLGGDEFVVVVDRLGPELEAAQRTAERVAQGLLQRLSRPYELEVGLSHHSASIGVAVLDDLSPCAEDLMQHADVALYAAKGGGRSLVRIFNPTMQLEVTQRVQLEQQLRQALDHHEMALHLQAIVDRDGQLCGAEALLRWQQAGSPMVLPDRFIPVAEDSGLIHQLGAWSLQRVSALLTDWSAHLDATFRISLNLSAAQFLHPDFVERTLDGLQEHAINPQQLKLEITEATVLNDLGQAARQMGRLRDHGLEFSMDDFGTGFSSISYLRQLPLTEVKIDKSYVRDFLHNPSDAAVVRAVLGLCRSLGLSVVAEGVETEEQWRQLRDEGCDRFQGFLFSRPREPGPEPDSLMSSEWRQMAQALRRPA